MNERLNVLYTCDENYAPYACISMASLFENNKDIENITVYLVESGLCEESKSRIRRQAELFGRELILVDSSHLTEKISALGIPSYRGSASANFRMFFHTFVRPNTKRLLYLDCDTLVVGSLSSLLTVDLGGKAVGVVRDSLTSKYKTLIGLDENEDYFNTGMILFDVEKWLSEGIADKIVDHVQNVRAGYVNPDQDLLNMVLRYNKLILPPEYNFQPSHRAFSDKAYRAAYKHKSYYTDEELENARQNPKILHTYRFLGDFPWHAGNLHPDTPLFDQYMKASEWSDYEKKSADRGLIFKIEKLLYRIMPRSLFLKFFEFVTFRDFRKKNAELEKNS